MHPALRLLLLLTAAASASAQAVPATSRFVTPTLFAGATIVSTGLDSGRNSSVLAGLDLAFLPGHRLQPSAEYRAMFAVDHGQVDGLKNNLGGLKLATRILRASPYLDLLAGRGETNYVHGGYQVPSKPIFYTLSSSNVFSLGAGADILALRAISVKADFQIQRYSSPVTTSGHLYSETATLGLAYTFHFGHRSP